MLTKLASPTSAGKSGPLQDFVRAIGEEDEYIVFSKLVEEIAEDGSWKQKHLVLTDRAVYSFWNLKKMQMKRRIPIEKIIKLTASKVSPEMILHVTDDDDYYFKMLGQEKMISSITRLYDNAMRKELEVEIVWKLTLTSLVKMKAKPVGFLDIVPSRLADFMQKKKDAREARVSEILEDEEELGDCEDPVDMFTAAEEKERSKEKEYRIEDFEFLKVLGRGSFAKVVQVRCKDNGKIYAMKILKKHLLIKRKQVQHTLTEKEVLRSCASHPFISKLKAAFQSRGKLYLVMEFYRGGELFFHLKNKRFFSEDEARIMVAEVASALAHLHSKNFIYRDLKPENLLLDEHGHCYIADFGLSKKLVDKKTTTTMCGTPEYLAPEVHAGKEYGKEIDWWALGILLYELCVGVPPFYSENMAVLVDKIAYSRLQFPPGFSASFKDLIHKLLNRTPAERLGYSSAEDVLSHDFFKPIDREKLLRKEITPLFKPETATDDSELVNFDKEFTGEKLVDSGDPVTFLARFTTDKDQTFGDWTFASKVSPLSDMEEDPA